MYEIKTTDYIKSKKILIDGKTWTMNAPGAGDELALAQAQRRSELIQKKINDGTAVDADYDLYDKLEDRMFKIFGKLFRDSTPDNAEVIAWLETTPMSIINAIMEDIKAQSEVKENGQTEVS